MGGCLKRWLVATLRWRGTCAIVLTRIGPVWVPLACLHDALASWTRALVLDCNGSGDIGVVSLRHVLATHVITCVWPTAVHPRIGVLTSCQALITLGTNGVDCTLPRGPISRQHGLVIPRPTLSVHLLRISPIQPALSCCLRGLVFLVL